MTREPLPLDGEERNGRKGWPLLAMAVAGPAGLSPIEVQSVLLLVGKDLHHPCHRVSGSMSSGPSFTADDTRAETG